MTGRVSRRKRITLAADILGGSPRLVDHINRDMWDNRVENLRVCSNSQNAVNRKTKSKVYTVYRGIQKHKTQWKARLKFKRQEIYLGLFDTEIEAAKAYNEAALLYHKEFAILNKI